MVDGRYCRYLQIYAGLHIQHYEIPFPTANNIAFCNLIILHGEVENHIYLLFSIFSPAIMRDENKYLQSLEADEMDESEFSWSPSL